MSDDFARIPPSEVVRKFAARVPVTAELLFDFGAISEPQYRVLKGRADRNPFPRFRLFSWWPRA